MVLDSVSINHNQAIQWYNNLTFKENADICTNFIWSHILRCSKFLRFKEISYNFKREKNRYVCQAQKGDWWKHKKKNIKKTWTKYFSADRFLRLNLSTIRRY